VFNCYYLWPQKYFLTKVIYPQSILLSKALKMQQDLEDKRQEVIIEDLENKIKEQSAAIEKKDFELQTAEGLLVDAEAKITELNSKLLSQSENFEQEKLKLDAKLEAEAQRNSELKESLKNLQNKCLEFSSRCIHQLKQVFHFVGASSEEFTPSVKTCLVPLNTLRVKLMILTKL
jgi:chromosome segregation ATPase